MRKICYICGEEVGSSWYVLKKAVKPPRTPNRWVEYGVLCECCGDTPKNMKFFRTDLWKEEVPI